MGYNKLTITDDIETSFDSLLCDTPRLVIIKINSLVFKLRVNTGNTIKIYKQDIRVDNLLTQFQITIKKYNVRNEEECALVQNQITEIKLKKDVINTGGFNKIKNRIEPGIYAEKPLSTKKKKIGKEVFEGSKIFIANQIEYNNLLTKTWN